MDLDQIRAEILARLGITVHEEPPAVTIAVPPEHLDALAEWLEHVDPGRPGRLIRLETQPDCVAEAPTQAEALF